MDDPPCSLCRMTANMCFTEEEFFMEISLQRPRSRLVFWLELRNPARSWWSFICASSLSIPVESEQLGKARKIDLSRFLHTMTKKAWQMVMRAGPLIFLLPLLPAMNAGAASFDCAKASTKVEKLICADAELSRLDKEIAAAYAQLLSLLDSLGAKLERKKFQELRQRWAREDIVNCKDVNCLKNSYKSQILFLHRSIDNRENLKKALEKGLLYGYCGNLTLASHCGDQSGVGSDVCEDYLDYLNTLKARPVCETPVPPQFKRPDWQEVDVRTHLELAYQAECAAWGDNDWFQKKFPDFATWKKRFLAAVNTDGIEPIMRRTKVLAKIGRTLAREQEPAEYKEVEILAYKRNNQACTDRLVRGKGLGPDYYSSAEGDYVYSTFTGNPDTPLEAIGTHSEGEILLYQNDLYAIVVFNISPDTDSLIAAGAISIDGPLEFYESSQPSHYSLRQQCGFRMVQQPK